jgi:hypothetical protein
LFKAIVLDVWKGEQARAREVEQLKGKRVGELKARVQRLEEAFIYERAIDSAVYERQRDKLQEELTLAELELHEARIDQTDVEGVMGFAEYLLGNVARVWVEASLRHRQQIQQAIFPKGLPFDGQHFGTAPTCLAFSRLQQSAAGENGVASPQGFEPWFQP